MKTFPSSKQAVTESSKIATADLLSTVSEIYPRTLLLPIGKMQKGRKVPLSNNKSMVPAVHAAVVHAIDVM